MQSQAQLLISLFRTIVLAGVTALLIMSAALPMPAQNSVPPTAVQAARMPQFASRLAIQPVDRHRGRTQRLRAKGLVMARRKAALSTTMAPSTAPPMPGRLTSDLSSAISFTIVDATSVNGMNFGAWLFPGTL